MKNNLWGVAFLFAAALLFQVVVFQQYQINYLKQELKISEKAKEIEEDQTQDLMYQLTQHKIESEALATKYFVAGVVEAISKPDRFSEIWHSGYDRGSSVQQYADKLNMASYTTNSSDQESK
jgi:hypothetical protein